MKSNAIFFEMFIRGAAACFSYMQLGSKQAVLRLRWLVATPPPRLSAANLHPAPHTASPAAPFFSVIASQPRRAGEAICLLLPVIAIRPKGRRSNLFFPVHVP